MIDFRYHLVSLVSVFLALAVGIVLGAGPLKDPIGEGLSQSVQQLRQSRDDLSDELKTAQAAARNRDMFVSQVEGQLVANQLGGRSVVVVALPGVEGDAVRSLTDTLAAAGATVTGRIDVQESWGDPGARAARDGAVAALRATAGLPATSGTGTGTARAATPTPTATPLTGTAGDVAAAQVLARALVTTELSASAKSDQASRALLEGLTRAGLVEVSDGTPGRATQAVVLVPGVDQAVQAAATPSPSAPAAVTAPWVALAAGLDGGSTGAVVVGPASAATAGGVLAAVRAQPPLASTVSTVDTGSTPMGDVTTVLALREQQLGGAGGYGFGDGAKAVLPGR